MFTCKYMFIYMHIYVYMYMYIQLYMYATAVCKKKQPSGVTGIAT